MFDRMGTDEQSRLTDYNCASHAPHITTGGVLHLIISVQRRQRAGISAQRRSMKSLRPHRCHVSIPGRTPRSLNSCIMLPSRCFPSKLPEHLTDCEMLAASLLFSPPVLQQTHRPQYHCRVPALLLQHTLSFAHLRRSPLSRRHSLCVPPAVGAQPC